MLIKKGKVNFFFFKYIANKFELLILIGFIKISNLLFVI